MSYEGPVPDDWEQEYIEAWATPHTDNRQIVPFQANQSAGNELVKRVRFVQRGEYTLNKYFPGTAAPALNLALTSKLATVTKTKQRKRKRGTNKSCCCKPKSKSTSCKSCCVSLPKCQ